MTVDSKSGNSVASISVRDAEDADAGDWDQFVASQSSGTFYHLFGWRTVVRTSLDLRPIYLMASQQGRLVGVLPLVLLSSHWFGRILCSMPFLNYGGPCAESNAAALALVTAAVERTKECHADYMEMRCAFQIPLELPVSLRKISMLIALDPNPDVTWNAFSRKHRKNIRRAVKSGLTVEAGGAELLEDFYSVLERSWRDQGTPLYRRDFFESVLMQFPQSMRIYLCRHGNRVVSVAMTGKHGAVTEGFWAGGLPSARELQANYVLYWEMIREVSLHGSSLFHLGRSTAESGSEQFKSRWNAEPRQLYWYYYRPDGGEMPALHVDNPRYKLAIATWRRLPLWLTRRIGPHIARAIP